LSAPSRVLRAATRGSELARWQAEHVATLLRAVDPSVDVELVIVQTTGDQRLDVPIWEMGGKGVFATEVQAAVLDGRADFAVHSGKDLPSVTVDGLTLAAIPTRGDARDALVGNTLDTLPPGARVGTGSVRRRAQLANLRPDLTFGGLRGNMATRLAKAADFDAIVVAAVAFERLGLGEHLTHILEPSVLLPQVAQGALAIEARVADDDLRSLLRSIEDPVSRRCVDSERGFLAELGGDCNLPAGAYATVVADGILHLDALLATLDGRIVLRHAVEAAASDDAAQLGRRAARYLLDEAGGASLLAG